MQIVLALFLIESGELLARFEGPLQHARWSER
jgi:hypothetical protein